MRTPNMILNCMFWSNKLSGNLRQPVSGTNITSPNIPSFSWSHPNDFIITKQRSCRAEPLITFKPTSWWNSMHFSNHKSYNFFFFKYFFGVFFFNATQSKQSQGWKHYAHPTHASESRWRKQQLLLAELLCENVLGRIDTKEQNLASKRNSASVV